MVQSYEDGLHLVSEYPPQQGQFSTLPELHQPLEKLNDSAPQPYIAEKSPEAAPVPVLAEDVHPPVYDGSIDHQEVEKSPAQTPRKILGFPRRTAVIIGSIVIAAILALVIGLAVGLTQRGTNSAEERFSSSSPASVSTGTSSLFLSTSNGATLSGTQTVAASSTSTSSTATAVATSGFTGISEVNCPGINNTVATSGSSRFQVLCSVHWITGAAAANNNGTVQAVGDDKLVAYSLEECLGHCVEYNNQLNGTVNANENGSGCLAVTYNANLTNAFAKYQTNCFLKDRQGVYDPAADTTESAILISV